MNLKDYFEKNPGLLSQFKKCSSKDEFIKVAESNNIRFGAGKLDNVYNYVESLKNSKNGGELSEEALSAAAGGVANVTEVEGVATLMA